MAAKTYDVAPLPGFEPVIGVLAAALEDSTREWRGELEAPPIEAIVWQPFAGGHSIGGLLLHMADCELSWIEDTAAGWEVGPERYAEFDPFGPVPSSRPWPAPPAEPIEWYFAKADAQRRRTLEALAELREPDAMRFVESWDTEFSVSWIVNHVVQHDSYHGGQAVLLHEIWKSR